MYCVCPSDREEGLLLSRPPVSAVMSAAPHRFPLHRILFAPTSHSLSATSSLHVVRFAIFRPLAVHPANHEFFKAAKFFSRSKLMGWPAHAVDSAVRYYCQHPSCLFELNCCHPYLRLGGGALFPYFPERDPMYCAHTLGFKNTMVKFSKLAKCYWSPDSWPDTDTILSVFLLFLEY